MCDNRKGLKTFYFDVELKVSKKKLLFFANYVLGMTIGR